MKTNHLLFIVFILGLTSCGTLKISHSMHTPCQELTHRVNIKKDSLMNYLDQNQAIINLYTSMDSIFNTIYGRKILNMGTLNASASRQVKGILRDPTTVVNITDKLGVTRIQKSLIEGNLYIYEYVNSLWSFMYKKLSAGILTPFDEIWNDFTRSKSDVSVTDIYQVNPITGDPYLYTAFQKYYEAFIHRHEWSEIKFHETILEGNLNFIIIEQLVAQNFIRKALTVYPLGSNPFNLGGRKVEVNIGDRCYSNRDNKPLKLDQIHSQQVIDILNLFDPLIEKPVKYHQYTERMPFILSIAINEHLHFMKSISLKSDNKIAQN